MKYPLAHKVIVPKAYVPAVATDIAKTIRAERKRIAERDAAKLFPKSKPYMPAVLPADAVVLTWPRVRHE